MFVLPSGDRYDATGILGGLLLLGVWDGGALVSSDCTPSEGVSAAAVVLSVDVSLKNDKFVVVVKIPGDAVLSRQVTGEPHKMSESGGGLSEHDGARCFPLILSREGEWKRCSAAGRLSSSLPP